MTTETTPVEGEAKPAVIPTPLTLNTEPVVAATPAVEPTPVVNDTPVIYEATGDRGLDMALAFIGKQGLAGDHPAVQAAAEGDFTLLKATLAQKGVQGYAEFVELGEQAYARTQEKNKAAAEATRAAVHAAAGGEEQWAAIQKWASANASPEEKAEINEQLNKGGIAAKAAVTYLMTTYAKSADMTQEPASAVKPGASLKPAAPVKMTAAVYAEEVAALNVKLRGRLDGSPEYEALQRRRLASL